MIHYSSLLNCCRLNKNKIKGPNYFNFSAWKHTRHATDLLLWHRHTDLKRFALPWWTWSVRRPPRGARRRRRAAPRGRRCAAGCSRWWWRHRGGPCAAAAAARSPSCPGERRCAAGSVLPTTQIEWVVSAGGATLSTVIFLGPHRPSYACLADS